MNPYFQVSPIFLAVILLAGQGCSIARAPQAGAPVEEQSSAAAGVPESAGVETGISRQPGARPRADTPAVTELLATAQLDMEGGRHESAAATLERALRLEPKDALLWYRLALIRHVQRRWQQVLYLAQKSNSLAAGDLKLQLQNWRLIAMAYEHLNNRRGTEHAQAIIQRLEQQLGIRSEG